MQYVNNFLVWHKEFGPAQNILGPVKGQGINVKLLLTFSFIRFRLPISCSQNWIRKNPSPYSEIAGQLLIRKWKLNFAKSVLTGKHFNLEISIIDKRGLPSK